ncbi:MAG: abortive infection protein [Cyanobacteria bacterium RYN_339]|nr:abortive infection protein [Cyanobacteria bacterium RYN_339]
MNAPSPGRAAGALGAGLLMGATALAALYNTGETPVTWASVITSLAIGVPALVAFYRPTAGAPGDPPYQPLSRWFAIGVACCSLPVYVLLALMQVAIGMHMRVHGSGTPGALVAGSGPAFVGIWIAIALLPALAEELIFRGMVQQAAVARLGVRWGILVAAAVFSFIHAETVGFVPRLLMGAWFGLLFWRSGSLWASTLAHALNNSWGLVVANLGTGVETHLGWVAAGSIVMLGLGLAAFHRGGYWPGQAPPPASPDVEPLLPRVITMQRPPEDQPL